MKNTEKLYLGIELGSTRIKSVLINSAGDTVAKGSHTWENRLENGLWTYREEDIHGGFSACVSDILENYQGIPDISAMGVSAMMHGYIALDGEGNMIAPFLTWRNTNAEEAASVLTSIFGVNVPMRWSIAQLYQAILDGKEHLHKITKLTTLSGCIHYKLTGNFVIGIGDASGMFPIDAAKGDYNQELLDKFDGLIASKGYSWKIRDILPRVLCAGEDAGCLTREGIEYMGSPLKAGVALVPPEGDAGTGMVATNSIRVGTGNVSAGTSVFAMIVTKNEPKSLHTEIDPVTTPDGKPVSMVHCNNCTSDINAWAGLFCDFAKELGFEISLSKALEIMFESSKAAKGSLAHIISYNYISGEPISGVGKGIPMLMRCPDARLTLPDFARSQIYACVAGLALGMEILEDEGIEISQIYGHGGFFKTPKVGQRAMSAALAAPVSVMENAGEGGAWGMAVLAALPDSGLDLEKHLDRIFEKSKVEKIMATEQEISEFAEYLDIYKKGLDAEKQAASKLW